VIAVTSWVWSEERGAPASDATRDAPVAELRTRILLPELVYVDFEVSPDALQGGPARWKELTGSLGGWGEKQRGEVEVVNLVLGGRVRVGKLRLAADFEVRGDEIEVLGVTSRLEELASEGSQVERIELKLAERAGIELLGYDFRFEVHEMITPGGALDTMIIDVRLDNLLPEIRAAIESGAPPAAADLTALLEKAALSSPALTVRELRMKGSQAGVPLELDVRGNVSIDGARVQKPLTPTALLECVDADLELRISQDVVASALRMQPGAKVKTVDARLLTEPLVLGGYFEREGAYLQATLQMRGSKSVLLNGQPMDPALRQLASLTDQVRARGEPSSRAVDPDGPWQPDGSASAELDEMRRQMGLK
jgi:hypothetical protein